MLEKGVDSQVIQSVPRVQDELILQPSEVLSELTNARLVDPVYQLLFALRDALSGPYGFRKSVHVTGSQI